MPTLLYNQRINHHARVALSSAAAAASSSQTAAAAAAKFRFFCFPFIFIAERCVRYRFLHSQHERVWRETEKEKKTR